MLNWLVIGIGDITRKRVIPAILSQPRSRLYGIVSRDPEKARPFFRETRSAFGRIAAAHIPNVEMRQLSMGMSNSYMIAIEEGSNMIRLGTELFGFRGG